MMLASIVVGTDMA